MKRGTFALILILLLALIICTTGCAKEEIIYTPTTTPAVTLTPVVTPTPTAKQTPTITPTHTYTPTPTPAVLLLEITQPKDGAQVSTGSITVSGKTIPGAVVSVAIDDTVAIADIDQDGNFSVTVNLEEGPNLIEVVASDQLGNEKSSSIAVIYVP